ncbi:MAG: D-alanyl-D-alanine dipeptidase [Proteobacteria bacterium]|nr:D-alanyl-D-alanine dipeptidase [Pseudomonadota bacterium]
MVTKLIPIDKPGFDVDLDIRYATDNNFTGKPIYSRPGSYLHPEAAKALQWAIELAALQGLRFKIFDTFRPREAQVALFNHTPDPNFISHPDTGSVPHCRGVAVDLTLIDKKGKELDMGTDFDAFTPLSFHGSRDVSLEAQKNRYLLMGIMTTAGWDFYRNEWWHYQLFKPREFEILTDELAGTKMMPK